MGNQQPRKNINPYSTTSEVMFEFLFPSSSSSPAKSMLEPSARQATLSVGIPMLIIQSVYQTEIAELIN